MLYGDETPDIPWYDMPGAVEYQQVGGLDTDDDYSDPDWF
jgi:hypothetical protein